MREVNEAASAHAAQRATAEAIERGGTGLSVDELLARVARPGEEVRATEGARAADSGGPRAGTWSGLSGGPVPGAEAVPGEAEGLDVEGGVGTGTGPLPRKRPVSGTEPVPGKASGVGPASGSAVELSLAASAPDRAPAFDRGPAADPPPAPVVDAPRTSASDRTPATDPPPDLDALATLIATAAGRHLPGGHLSCDADFFDAGGSSVNAVELVAELEDRLGLEIDLDEVFADARPRTLARRWLEAVPAAGLGTHTTATAPRTPTVTPAPPTAIATATPAPPSTVTTPGTAPIPAFAPATAPSPAAPAPHST
ncbi:acyl carrier protein, partial [Streptomyces sp. AC555_RSS877]|uniref:acyl carrier protein n=1 Tax=Streptomyces sp. AC555_RSS877 TaxID=2823688 RepID=UPI001C25443A